MPFTKPVLPKGARARRMGWTPLALLLSATLVRAELSWPGCDPLKASDFKMVRLVGKSETGGPVTVDATLDEPVKLAFDTDAQGATDVYWVERKGGVKRYSTATRAVTLLGKLKPATGNEDGLVGIALDPGFKANHWMYLYYSFGTEFRVSRFTVAGNALDPASETVVLHIPSDRDKDHSGGPMEFDAYGDLWISVGENSSGERSAANSNDLRGGILRIHPTPDGKYTIPPGNWRETLAGSYPAAELEKVKPEIYVKGTRNAYTLTVDPVRRWLAWGDVGPDWFSSGDRAHPSEEHDLVKAPGYMGWPYFAGSNQCDKCDKDEKGPAVAFSGNTGLAKLPPAIPAIHPYPRSAAMTGPIYRYDGANPSRIKLPPHFQRKWFLSDFRSLFIAATLSEDGTRIVAMDTVFKDLSRYISGGPDNSNSLVELKQGPDGALYAINYNGWYTTVPSTNIARFEYSGTCLPAEPKLEQPTDIAIARSAAGAPGIRVLGGMLEVAAEGDCSFVLSDLAGRTLAAWNGPGNRRYALPSDRGAGVRILRVRTASGPEMSRRIVLP